MHILSRYIKRVIAEVSDDDDKTYVQTYIHFLRASQKKFPDITLQHHGLTGVYYCNVEEKIMFGHICDITIYSAMDFKTHYEFLEKDTDANFLNEPELNRLTSDMIIFKASPYNSYGFPDDICLIFSIEKMRRILHIAKSLQEFLILIERTGERRQLFI